MDLKRFKKGQTAYVVNLNKGSEYRPVTVTSAGRKYVTTNTGLKFEEGAKEDRLILASGWRTYLVPTEHEAKELIEKEELLLWLRKNFCGSIDDLPLAQLRNVKGILEPRKQDPDEYTLKVTVRTKFLDDESDAGTVRYCLEQDLEDAGWDCDVELAGRNK